MYLIQLHVFSGEQNWEFEGTEYKGDFSVLKPNTVNF